MSMTTAPAGPTVTWWCVFDGMRRQLPGRVRAFVTDREREAPDDDHAELLVLVTMTGHDRVGSDDERERGVRPRSAGRERLAPRR
jgi:hypothetical protein